VSPQRIYVYGAGGHGKVVADILRAAALPLAGFVDDSAGRFPQPVLGFPVISTDEWLAMDEHRAVMGVALGIGDNYARIKIADRCRSWGFEILTAVHPSAVVSPAALIGAGSVVTALASINAGAELGDGVIVNTGAVVEHDCIIGDYAHISPNAALAGGARLGAFSHLGIGAVVLPGIVVGAKTIIGAGAVVVHDIPEGVVAIGVPARVHAEAARRCASG